MAQVKQIRCVECGDKEVVNGEPNAKLWARKHRTATSILGTKTKKGHRDFLYVQATEVRV